MPASHLTRSSLTPATSRVTSRPPAPKAPVRSFLPGTASSPLNILLIDDDPAVRESLRRVLVSEGWSVVTASGGAEALEHLRQREPDLIITDLCMADVNGWDLLFHESLQRPHLPIFVITALSPENTAGADKFAAEFFEKPLDLDALLAAVRRHASTPA